MANGYYNLIKMMQIRVFLSKFQAHRNFYTNVIWQYVLQLAKYILPFLSFPYLTRVLQPETFAVYAYVTTLMSILQIIVDYGFTLYGTKVVSKIRLNKAKVDEIVGQITYARLIVSLIVSLLLCFLCVFIEILQNNFYFTLLCFISVVFNALLPDFVFQSFEKMHSLTHRYLLVKCISLVCIFLFVHHPRDLYVIAIINIVCSSIGYFWTLWAMNSIFGIRTNWKAFYNIFKQIKRSTIYCFSNISASLFSGFTTMMIGVIFADKSELAYWSLGITAIGAVQSLYSPITNSLYPHILNNRDFKFAYHLGLLFFPIVITGTILFVTLSDFIILILGGETYSTASLTLIWLSPMLPISFYAVFIGWPILGSIGEVKRLTYSTAIIGLINVLLVGTVAVFEVRSLMLICGIRVFIELLLLCSRAWILYSHFKIKELKCS